MTIRATLLRPPVPVGPGAPLEVDIELVSEAERPLIASVVAAPPARSAARPMILLPGEARAMTVTVSVPVPRPDVVTVRVLWQGGATEVPVPVPVLAHPPRSRPLAVDRTPQRRRPQPASPGRFRLAVAATAVAFVAGVLAAVAVEPSEQVAGSTTELGADVPASVARTELRGSVVLPDGLAPEDVFVTVAGRPPGEVELDGDGRFVVALPPGRYQLHVSAPGYLPHQQTVVLADEPVALPAIGLAPGGGTVRGVVRASDGTPLALALVEVVVDGVTVATFTTGSDGGYVAGGLDAPARARLRFSGPGHAPVEVEVAVAIGEVVGGIDVTLVPA